MRWGSSILATLIGSATVFPNGFADRDATYAQGRIVFSTSVTRDSGTTTEKIELIFNGESFSRVSVLASNRKDAKFRMDPQVETPHARYYIRKSMDKPLAEFSSSSFPDHTSEVFHILPKPCLALGLGFSKFPDSKVHRLGPTDYRFDLGRDAFWVAKFSAEHPDEPYRVERYGIGNQLIGYYEYRNYKRVSDKLRLPTEIEYQCSVQSFTFRKLTKLNSVEMTAQPESKIALPWLMPTLNINDRRVNPEVDWTYQELMKATGNNQNLTTDQLLELSKQKSKYNAQADAAVTEQISRLKIERDQTAQYWKLAGAIFSVGLVGILVRNFLAQLSRSKP